MALWKALQKDSKVYSSDVTYSATRLPFHENQTNIGIHSNVHTCTTDFSLIPSKNASLLISLGEIWKLLHILYAFESCTLIKDAYENLVGPSLSTNTRL